MFNIGLEKIISESAKVQIKNFPERKGKFLALDLGCGNGRGSVVLAKNGFSVNAVDFDKGKIEIFNNQIESGGLLKLKIKTFAVDVNNFEILNNTYDIILAINILHLLKQEDYKLIINEIYQGLKQGGQIIAVVKITGAISANDFSEFKAIELKNFKDSNGDNYFLFHAIKPFG